jgi:hypothetical protein
MKGDSLTGIVLVGFTIWLLFMGGLDAVSRATATVGPIAPAIQTGIQRLQATPAVQVSAFTAPTQPPTQPTSAPAIAPAVGQVAVIPATPTPAPPTAIPQPTATPTVQYPSAGLAYEVRTVNDRGYEQQCVYVSKLNKRVCEAPGLVITDYKASLYAGYLEAGLVPGEPIP